MTDARMRKYLERLGFDGELTPTAENLRILHRAHVERIPYETLDFQLGRAPGIDPGKSADRLANSSRGGYCFHLNGAFAWLLAALGYQVRTHRVGVQKVDEAVPPGINGNHMALTVVVPSAPDGTGGTLLVDVGLGFAFHEPLPLRPGSVGQGPFGYELGPSPFEAGAWRLDHRPLRGFAGADISLAPARPADFAEEHARLSTAPDSDFVRLARVQRRDADGTDLLLGCVLTRITAAGDERTELDTATEWFDALRSTFGIHPDAFGADGRDRLWRTVRAGHEEWRRSVPEAVALTP
ncbi:arylamine N-acetyltransferase family protein [Streptomyces anulatus]|uniref:arylamine N-acetyltransferase family protein n=1 Tax=Streptomyces anulatus TaxID=1892 RepID=UPI001C25A640|nr:arylamine N-acetyltransferase [Streptomyces anulatus]